MLSRKNIWAKAGDGSKCCFLECFMNWLKVTFNKTLFPFISKMFYIFYITDWCRSEEIRPGCFSIRITYPQKRNEDKQYQIKLPWFKPVLSISTWVIYVVVWDKINLQVLVFALHNRFSSDHLIISRIKVFLLETVHSFSQQMQFVPSYQDFSEKISLYQG